MRRAAFQINGQWHEGHFDVQPYQVGDVYEMRNSGKVMVVEHVFDGKFEVREDGVGYFYKLRSATPAEVETWRNGPTVEETKATFDKFFDKVELF